MSVTSPFPPASPEQPFPLSHLNPKPPKRNRSGIIVASVVGGVVALLLVSTLIAAAVNSKPTPANTPTPAVPVVENIPRPNVACVPAAEKKLGFGDDLTQIQWFGWMDGKQADMPAGQAMAQKIAGHDVRDAWYCPPRADWH